MDSLTPCRVRWVLCSVPGGMVPSIACYPVLLQKSQQDGNALLLGGCSRNGPAAQGMSLKELGRLKELSHTAMSPCVPGQGCAPALGLSSWLGTEEPSGSWEQCSGTETSAVIVRCGYGLARITQRNRPRFPHAEGVLLPQCFSPPSYPFTAGLLPFLCQKSVLVREKSSVSVIFAAAWLSWLCPCREGI